MAIWLIIFNHASDVWSQWSWLERITQLVALIIPAILCYIAALWIMGVRPRHLAH